MQILSKLHSISRYGIPAVFLSSVTNKAIGFVSNMIVIRILSVEEYGLQASLYTVLSLIGLFVGGGMGSPLIIYGSEWRSPSEKNQIRIYTLYCGVLFSILVGFIQILLGLFVFKDYPILHQYLPLLSMVPVISYINSYIQILMRTMQDNQGYARLTFLHTLVGLVSTLCGIAIAGLSGLIWYRVIGSIFMILIGMKMCPVKLDIGFDLQNFSLFKMLYPSGILKNMKSELKKELWAFAIKAGLTSILNSTVLYLDVFMITMLLKDPELIASYKIACLIPDNLNFLPGVLMIALVPRFAQCANDKEWFKDRFKRLFIANLIVQGVISLFLILFAREIITFLWTEKYLDSTLPFQILSFSYLWMAGIRIFSTNMLSVLKKTTYNLFVSILLGIVNITLDLLLITRWQMIGAALATLFSVIFVSAMTFVYLIYVIYKSDQSKAAAE